MSKVIKVDEEVYEGLDQLRGKGETFGQVIEQLLQVREVVLGAINVLETKVKYRQWQEERLRAIEYSEEAL